MGEKEMERMRRVAIPITSERPSSLWPAQTA
jgi:hypothetical protein